MRSRDVLAVAALGAAVSMSGCLSILGIDKDYEQVSDTPAGGGGSGSGAGGMGTGGAGTGGMGTGGAGTGTGGQGGSSATAGGCSPGERRGCYSGLPPTAGIGVCVGGEQACDPDGTTWGSCEGEVTPTAETCNGLDDDCDGQNDEDVTQPCYTGPPATQGVGSCRAGLQACSGGAWGACVGETTPRTERCNGADDDCDNAIDEETSGAACDTGEQGRCAEGSLECDDGTPLCVQLFPARPELQCNGEDDDCDGLVDECFAGGTRIAMADGTDRLIEDVVEGDWVLSYDTLLGLVVPSPVTKKFVHAGARDILRINGSLRATGNHPFYANGRWVRAEDLSVDDQLLRLDPASTGAAASVSPAGVSSLLTDPARETTYNLEVARHHNYFAEGVLVHNKIECSETPSW